MGYWENLHFMSRRVNEMLVHENKILKYYVKPRLTVYLCSAVNR